MGFADGIDLEIADGAFFAVPAPSGDPSGDRV